VDNETRAFSLTSVSGLLIASAVTFFISFPGLALLVCDPNLFRGDCLRHIGTERRHTLDTRGSGAAQGEEGSAVLGGDRWAYSRDGEQIGVASWRGVGEAEERAIGEDAERRDLRLRYQVRHSLHSWP